LKSDFSGFAAPLRVAVFATRDAQPEAWLAAIPDFAARALGCWSQRFEQAVGDQLRSLVASLPSGLRLGYKAPALARKCAQPADNAYSVKTSITEGFMRRSANGRQWMQAPMK